MTHRYRRPSRALTIVLAALTALALVGLGPVRSAEAADTGWIRLTHLSPDTPEVNVALTSISDSTAVIELKDVGYGDISPYSKVKAGKYVATMTPAGGNADSEPAVSQPVTVAAGKAYTVAAMGKNADLKGTVLTDDLDPGTKGKAKVRVLQAAISAPEATVSAEGGPTIADNAAFGTATEYATVDAGAWTVKIDPTGEQANPATAELNLKSASVNTVIVLDAEGDESKVTVKVVTDAGGMSSAEMPKKGVETGGGGLATERRAPSAALLGGLITVFVVASAVVIWGRRSLGGTASLKR